MNRLKEEFIAQVEQHRGIIAKVSRLYCSNPLDQEDLFQDIVLQLWKAYPSFKAESKISTWIYRVALNVAVTRLRKESKVPSNQPVDFTVMNIPDTSTSDDKSAAMYRAITQLSDTDKALVMLYMDNYSYKEIAAIAGITESNVGYKLSRIRETLRTLVVKE